MLARRLEFPFILAYFSFVSLQTIDGSNCIGGLSDTVSFLYQSRISISGSYQQSSKANGESKSVLCVFTDGFFYRELDSVWRGNLSLQLKGRLFYMRQEKATWRKSEDLWSCQIDWLKRNARTLKTSLIVQLESPLLNKYGTSTKVKEEGLFLPFTLHLAYGWTVLSSSGNWRADLMISDFRYKRYRTVGVEKVDQIAEFGVYLQTGYRQCFLNKVIATINFNGEFSHAMLDGYGYQSSLKVDWLVWKFLRLSILVDANRSRITGQFEWTALAMAGFGFDWSR